MTKPPPAEKKTPSRITQKTLVHGEKTLFTEFRLEKGATSQPRPPHEQTGYLVKGRIRLTIGLKPSTPIPATAGAIPEARNTGRNPGRLWPSRSFHRSGRITFNLQRTYRETHPFPHSIIRQSRDIIASDIDDESHDEHVKRPLLRTRFHRPVCLGHHLEKPTSVSCLVDALRREYDVDPETCEKDVLAFLENLHADGIIEVGESPSA